MFTGYYLFFSQWPVDWRSYQITVAYVFKWTPAILDSLTLQDLEHWHEAAEQILEKNGGR